MTTPDTTAVRAWARNHGYSVADRGRLPADVQKAYAAAQREPNGGEAAGTKTAAAKAAPKAAAAKAAAPKAKAAPKAAPKAAKPAARKVAKRGTSAAGTKPGRQLVVRDAAEVDVVEAPAATTPESIADAGAEPSPKPSLVSDDRRLVALGEELAALTERVAALEAAAAKSGGRSGSKTPRFLRPR